MWLKVNKKMVYLTEIEVSIMMICPNITEWGNDKKGTHVTKEDYKKLEVYAKSLIEAKEKLLVDVINKHELMNSSKK